MRDAPPVTLPAGRSPSVAFCSRDLTLALALAGVGLSGLWAWEVRGGPFWPPLLGLAVWLGYAAWAWADGQRALRDSVGALAWDGEAWYWREADHCSTSSRVAPIVCLDLQGLLLLRLIPLDPPTRPQQWLWLTSGRDPGRWRALRRALYSTRSRPVQ